MDVVIRRASESDAPALARVGAILFQQTYEGSIPPDEMASHLENEFGTDIQLGELRDPSISSFLVEGAGEVVGFAQIRGAPLPGDSSAVAEFELWRIYLDRSLHGRGIARRLLSELRSEAREMGATGVWLAVWEQNARAIAFYKKHGFEPVGRQEFHVGGEVHCDLVFRGPADAF